MPIKDPVKLKIYMRQRSKKWRAVGRCGHCGKPAPSSFYCDTCKVGHNRRSRNRNERSRRSVFDYYGNECACCGEDDKFALTIDHINNDGAAHRAKVLKKREGSGIAFYVWLRLNGYPDGFQTLCYTCNAIKEFHNHGETPKWRVGKHEAKREEIKDMP